VSITLPVSTGAVSC